MKKTIELPLLLALVAVLAWVAHGKIGQFLCGRGDYYLENSLYKEAIAAYSNSIRVDPRLWQARIGLAQAYGESGDYDNAIRTYENIISMNPSYFKAYEGLIHLYSQNGRYEEALNLISRGQKKNPSEELLKNAREDCCRLYFADALNKSNDLFLAYKYKEAISVLGKVLSFCPGNALAYYTLGCYYFSDRDYSKAELNLNKAIEADPKYYDSYKVLADIYLKRGDTEKAFSLTQKALSMGGKDASNYNDLGLSLRRLERYPEAIVYLKKAVELDPNNADYIYNLGGVYRDNKMYDQAISEYDKAGMLKADYPNLHNELADIYLILGRPDQALAEYRLEIRYDRERLQSSPGDPVTLNNYAYALNGAGDSGEAQAIAEQLISSYPLYGQAHFTLAAIYEKTGRHDLALASLEKVKQLSGGENFTDKAVPGLKENYLMREGPGLQKPDLIYLKNGRKIQGKIKKEYPDRVVLEVWFGDSKGEMVFDRRSIERIERSQEGS